MGEKQKLEKSLVHEADDPLAPQLRTASPKSSAAKAKSRPDDISDENEVLYNPFMRMSADRLHELSKAETQSAVVVQSPSAQASEAPEPPSTWAHKDERNAQSHGKGALNGRGNAVSSGRQGAGENGKADEKGQEALGLAKANGGEVELAAGEKLQLHILSRVAYVAPDRRTIQGSLVLTNYRMEFSPLRTEETDLWCHYPPAFFRIPVGMIRKIVRTSNGQGRRENSPYITISCKDFRVLQFGFEDSSYVTKVLGLIRSVAFPISETADVSWLFAFDHHNSTVEPGKPEHGWEAYDREKEWRRLKILDSERWRICRINHDYKFCPTYPNAFIIPRAVTDETIALVGQFRSKSRVPIMSWLHWSNGGSIWRCSQPKVGIGHVSVADEKLVAQIRACTPASHVRIIDCRPFTNAVSNRIKGMGYEDEARYAGTSISFQNIQNIHSVRASYDKLFQLAKSSSGNSASNWLSQVEGTGWLNHIRSILVAAIKLVSYVGRQGLAVIVHCSDGWDRTSQVTALSQLLLDPYYRTIKGFQILVEKEWLTVGYKFQSRTGHGKDFSKDLDADKVSPVFLQFIDCTWQLTRLFPKEFEFNERFLIALLDHLYSCQFGTFLYDSDFERKSSELYKKTRSSWEALHPSRQDLKNPFFESRSREIIPSRPIAIARQVVLWSDYYLRYSSMPSINAHAFGSSQARREGIQLDPYLRMQIDLSDAHKKIKELQEEVLLLRGKPTNNSP